MNTKAKIGPFSDYILKILVSIVTLLLQMISFATTWEGSKVYLEGIFPFASLLFALAIQSTAYFLSNSLRSRISALKITALFAALCCSTYYSYIGIYHAVNSPTGYLQQSYAGISDELTRTFSETLQTDLTDVRTAVSNAASAISAKYTALTTEQERLAACRDNLSQALPSYAESLRAPNPSSYTDYEDYVAAYQAYIHGITTGSSVESEAQREQILASYGFASIEVLQDAILQNESDLSALLAAVPVEEDSDLLQAVNLIRGQLFTAVENASLGKAPNEITALQFQQLFHAASLCGSSEDASLCLTVLDQCANASATPLLTDYDLLAASLPKQDVMSIKEGLDAQILSALLKLNLLLPADAQIALTDARYQITDLYLLPVFALKDPATAATALFCLFVAALIDGLSLLFALSLKGAKPLWSRRLLWGSGFTDYAPQIFAALPAKEAPAQSLARFLSVFAPSPETESAGYMMHAPLAALNDYLPLTALLCQLNLAKLLPAGTPGQDEPVLLLKARFVFWANEQIYDGKNSQEEVYA